MKTFVYNNIIFHVGTNDKENWSIISSSQKDHCWVHLSSIPSSHVIICIDKPLHDELVYAGELCKEQTKCNKNNVTCIATRVNNLKLGSKPGEVYFKNEKEIQTFTV
jgi:predicted ribosome quality control (RQC) complex YloA/Tae2 family protein